MEITGRLTRNAQVKTTTSGKEFISFSIAQNDSYKAKGSKKVTRIVTYIECTYWRGTNIAPFMTKGTIVELTGRIMANAWKNKEGEPKGQLACNVSTIKLLGGGSRTTEGEKQGSSKAKTEKAEESQPVAAGDDLPF